MSENNSPYQQVAVVCILHSKRDTGRLKTADIYKHENKTEFAYHFIPLSLRWFRYIATSNQEYVKMMNDQIR